MKLVEMHVVVLRRGVQADGDMHKPEGVELLVAAIGVTSFSF
jgi:hypothetical protein